MLMLAVLIEDERDEQRFTEMYLSYRKQMFYVANNILHQQELAEDAVQNAFFRLARYIKNVPIQPEACRAYVLTVAKNCAREVLRKEMNEKKAAELLEFEPTEEESLFSKVCRSEEYELLRRALEQLDPTYRDVLFLHYQRQLSAREISELLGRKVATVKQQITRGKKLLAAQCKKEGLRV